MRKEYLKIRDDVDLKELEKFGFEIKKENTVYDRGIEWSYCKDLGNVSYKIPFKRENWMWIGGFVPIRCIDMDANDYEMFPRAEDFVVLFDLIQAGLVEKEVEDE